MKMKQKVEKKSKMYVENDPFSRVIVILTIQSEKKWIQRNHAGLESISNLQTQCKYFYDLSKTYDLKQSD